MTTPLDEQYILNAQDPNEPVWETDSNIAGMQRVDDINDEHMESTPVIRTMYGALEFLNDLREVAHDFLAEDTPIPIRKPKLDVIRVRELGADKWRGGTRLVTEGMSGPIVTNSPYRRRITLVNYGPNIAYISPIAGAVALAPNTFPVPVTTAAFYAPLCIETKDDIWAICAATQTAAISILEEFDQEP